MSSHLKVVRQDKPKDTIYLENKNPLLNLSEIVNLFNKGEIDQNEYMKLYNDASSNVPKDARKRQIYFRKLDREEGKNKYNYIIKFQINEENLDIVDEIEIFVMNQQNRKALNILNFECERVLNKLSFPYFKVHIQTKQAIKKDNFKGYLKYGNIIFKRNEKATINTNTEIQTQDKIINKIYYYMLTFTIDPTKYPIITGQLIKEIENYIEEIPKKRGYVIKYQYCQEFHKNGRPHWHVLIGTTQTVMKSSFRQYKSKYGTYKYNRNGNNSFKEIVKYISKESEVKVII